MNTSKIHACLRAHGFAVEDTGGNCQAFAQDLPDGRYVMVTDVDGFLPEFPDSILVGVYPSREGTESGAMIELEFSENAGASGEYGFTHGDYFISDPIGGEFPNPTVDPESTYGMPRAVALFVRSLNSSAVEFLTPTALAKEFCAVIAEWLTPQQMDIVRERNRTIAAGCCATHDFCDANMAMAEAFENLAGFEPDTADDDVSRIWSTAWNLALAAGFHADQIDD